MPFSIPDHSEPKTYAPTGAPMTAPTHDTQVVMADAVIAQVIQLKDPDESISSAIWWRVAELLRACTTATASGPHLTTTLL
jgi:hypothetical protein